MKIEEFIKTKIKEEFSDVNNIEDLCALLNKAISYSSLHDIKPVLCDELNYYAFISKSNYRQFCIEKKSGGIREIFTPNKRLKEILKLLSFVLQCVFTSNGCSHGFIWNKSIVSNAKCHIGQNYVYNIDLESFFPSIFLPRIINRLRYEPFNLNNDKIKLSNLIANLCCTNGKNGGLAFLPQGAPTSPVLSNIICERLDRKLKGLSKKFNIVYTRYADDITFSSKHNVYQSNSLFVRELNKIVVEQNFNINSNKTRLQKRGYKQVVTGLIVNEKINVPIKFIKETRTLIHLINRFGLNDAQIIYKGNSYNSRRHINKIRQIDRALKGKLEYIKMVKGSNNTTYLNLLNKYKLLVN